jgi:RNA polymerase sigma factor (sigma-70 family)
VKHSSGTFEALYRAYAPGVFRRARNILQCEAEAQDVVSEIFISLYERPEQFEGRSALSTFLYSMTTNACLVRLRNRKKRASLLERAAEANAAACPLAPDCAAQLTNLLEKMPEELAQVAVYYYFDELTHEEIAEIMGCSRRHIGDLLARLSDWAQTGDVPL